MTMNNVTEFFGNAMQAFKEQVKAMEVMYNEIKGVKEKVDDTADEVRQIKEDIDKEIPIRPAEAGEMEKTVHLKAIEIVRVMGIGDPDEFKAEVGIMKRRIWFKVKKNLAVSKYIYIPRSRFQESIYLIESLSYHDFFDYHKKYNKQNPNQIRLSV